MDVRSEMGTQPDRGPKTLRHAYWMPSAVFVLGLLSVLVLLWSLRINLETRSNFARANSIMDMRILIASFHLWFEEFLNGDHKENFESTWADLERGISLVRIIVDGGMGEHDLQLEALEEPKYLAKVEEIGVLLAKLKGIAEQRLADPSTGGIGSELDERFDGVYKEFMLRASALEEIVETSQVKAQKQTERILGFTLLAWSIIVFVASAGLWTREKRRIAAELALQAQTDELQKHRHHLIELVEERTSELMSANKELHSEIAEHKRTHQELEENRNKFEKLSLEFNIFLDAIPDSLILFSPELKILWANRGAAARIGLEAPEIEGRKCHELRYGQPAPCEGCPVMRAFETGETESFQKNSKDGTIRDIRAFPIKDAQGKVTNVIEVAIDITEKLAIQAEAMRISHLASLGELAAGVAHEINNPINGIINYAQILLDESGQQERGEKILNSIIKEGDRIATIVRSLLSFARENKTEKAPVSVNEIFANVLSLLGRQLEKDGITLRTEIPEDLPEILANAQQIEQVLLNVVSNSRHALNLKYKEAEAEKIIRMVCKQTSINGRPHLEITVHDTGTGIAAGLIHKLIDPFFSTKPPGCGTGLGLSISHGIVSDHGGKLLIRSVEGEFTDVIILLPAV